MAIRVLIPGALRPFADGQTAVTLDRKVATVSEALQALWVKHPGLRLRVVNEQGEVRRHVNVFVGTESIRDIGGLEAPVADDAEIAVIAAVSGGATGEFVLNQFNVMRAVTR
jgi:sulfur-carrier protein